MLKGRVLLLNSDFQVLGTIGVARAIRMKLRKVNPIVVHENVPNTYLHDGNGNSYEVPSVISLKHYVNVRKNREESGSSRMKVYLRDGYKCQYCSIKIGKMFTDEFGKKRAFTVKDFTLDHITPKSKGGSSLASNLVTACKKCNQRKADRTPDEANMPLVTATKEMNFGVENLMLCKYVEHRPEWLPYLEGKEGFVEAYTAYKAMAA